MVAPYRELRDRVPRSGRSEKGSMLRVSDSPSVLFPSLRGSLHVWADRIQRAVTLGGRGIF